MVNRRGLSLASILLMGNLAFNSVNAVSLEEFSEYLEKQEVVRELPESANISLKVYDSDISNIVREYIIGRGVVEEGHAEKPDLEVYLDADWVYKMDDDNLCSVLREARSEEELQFKPQRSNFVLFWKYKGVLKYRGCLKGER
jgi:hypothetical protein